MRIGRVEPCNIPGRTPHGLGQGTVRELVVIDGLLLEAGLVEVLNLSMWPVGGGRLVTFDRIEGTGELAITRELEG